MWLQQSENESRWRWCLLFVFSWSGTLWLRGLCLQSPKQARRGNVLCETENWTERIDLFYDCHYMDTYVIYEHANGRSHNCIASKRKLMAINAKLLLLNLKIITFFKHMGNDARAEFYECNAIHKHCILNCLHSFFKHWN